jgi:hypothetical protein
MAQNESEDTIRNKIPDFIEAYPELFKKLIKKQDLTPIYGMLAMLDKMGQGDISQHQASIAVGKSLVDRFVVPSLNDDADKNK